MFWVALSLLSTSLSEKVSGLQSIMSFEVLGPFGMLPGRSLSRMLGGATSYISRPHPGVTPQLARIEFPAFVIIGVPNDSLGSRRCRHDDLFA